jgi:hypothetical protein
MDKETEKMYKGLYHDYEHNPDDQRLAPFDRLRNLLKDGDEIPVDEEIVGKIDFILGEKEKPTPNKIEKWTWAKLMAKISKFRIWLHLKLFPNPHYNKYYKRKK